MSFIVILLVLALQWFLNFNSAPYQVQWVHVYFQWMQQKFDALSNGHGLFAVLILVLPIVLLVSLVFTVIYHTLGHLGYLILSMALLWYFLNVEAMKETPSENASAAELFLSSYQTCFALLFWYFIFGPVGLTLYVVVGALRAHLTEKTDVLGSAQKYLLLTQGVLDWVPVRLVGLSFALGGNFGAVFKDWLNVLRQGIADNQHKVIVWDEAALSQGNSSASEAGVLLRRTLLIWLVAMALISLGYWIG